MYTRAPGWVGVWDGTRLFVTPCANSVSIDPQPAAATDRSSCQVGVGDNQPMASTVAPGEVQVEQPRAVDDFELDRPWIVIVWNDPINLMSYVTLVFQKLFGYSKEKATRLMLQVHNEGKAVVSSGTREKAEHDVSRLHAHGLWATMRQD